MALTIEELKDILIRSYQLLLALPKPKSDKNGKYEIKSRNKLRGLSEALREMDEPSAAIAHFAKSAAYFIPRGEGDMMDFLDLLLKDVSELAGGGGVGDHEVEKIKYLIGYLNWSTDAVCAIFTASGDVEGRIQRMLTAEFSVLGDLQKAEELTDQICQWGRN